MYIYIVIYKPLFIVIFTVLVLVASARCTINDQHFKNHIRFTVEYDHSFLAKGKQKRHTVRVFITFASIIRCHSRAVCRLVSVKASC